jgi:caspase domain-containing protein
MRIVWASALLAMSLIPSAADLQGQTKRALLVGIGHYKPSGKEAEALRTLQTSTHPPDSRFAAGVDWANLKGPLNDVEEMKELLEQRYGFSEIVMLKEKDATREGILKAIDDLTERTNPGDTVVFYFSGHGSQRLNRSRNKNQIDKCLSETRMCFDQTIVPADAYKGVYDIRDQELARKFNRILDDKKARLIAIFDSCHSGTMARTLARSPAGVVARALPYDDRDVAKDAQAYKGDDLKHVPKDGNAIIITAANSIESAQEAFFDDDQRWHGAFTRALVAVLKNASASWRAVDVISSTQSVMNAESLPSQHAAIEGRENEGLFGDPLPVRLRASVVMVGDDEVHLNLGRIAGFDKGTQFTAVSTNDARKKAAVLEVTSVDGPTQSTAKIVTGSVDDVSPGTLFEISKLKVCPDAKLRLFVPSGDWDPVSVTPQQIKDKFPGFQWVLDPALQPVQYYVTHADGDWRAFDASNAEISPAKVKALAGTDKPRTAFLALPASAQLMTALRQTPAFRGGRIELASSIVGSHYMLVGREGGSGLEYALLRSDFMGPRPPRGYVNNEPDSDVVCSTDRSLPVRTEWIHLSGTAETPDPYAAASGLLQGSAARIVKLRSWMLLQTQAQPARSWPYRLSIQATIDGSPRVVTPNTVLKPRTSYAIALVANKNDLATHTVVPLYVYVVGFDCAAHIRPLYPPESANGGAPQPLRNPDGTYPPRVPLDTEETVTPFGADSIFLLVTPERITDMTVFSFDGVIDPGSHTREIRSRLANMVWGLGDYVTRALDRSGIEWTIQQAIIPSQAAPK